MRRRELILVGGATAAARPLHAQRETMPVIGFLSGFSPGAAATVTAGVRQGTRFILLVLRTSRAGIAPNRCRAQ